MVHLSWKPENKDYPESRIFEGGYRMELALAPLDTGQLSGSLTLVMPDSFKSYLAGILLPIAIICATAMAR